MGEEKINNPNADQNTSEDPENGETDGGGLVKIVKDMGVIGLSRFLGSLSTIILIPVLTKNLGAHGYGLWSQALVTISLSIAVLRLGTDLSITRLFPAKNLSQIGEELSSILMAIIGIVGLFSLLLFLFPNLLADAVFDGYVLIVRIVAIIIFVQCLDKVFYAVFRAFREMKKYAIINVTRKYSEMGLATSLVFLGYGIIGAIFALLIVRGLLSLILFLHIRSKIELRKPNFSSLKEHFSIGIPAIPATISHLIVDVSDRYVIGFFLGATYVGYYTPGYSMGILIPKFITGVLAFVLLPNLSEYYDNGNLSKINQILSLSTKYFLIISIPSFVGFIIVGKPILTIFTTSEIAENGFVILVLSSFAGILVGLYTIFKQTLFLEKNTKLFSSLWAIGAVINFTGNIILVPRFGIFAAGITTIISYLFVTSFIFNFSQRKIGFKMKSLPIIKIILSSSMMGLFLYTSKSFFEFNTLFLLILGIFIYFSILYIFNGMGEKEIKFLKEIHKQ